MNFKFFVRTNRGGLDLYDLQKRRFYTGSVNLILIGLASRFPFSVWGSAGVRLKKRLGGVLIS